LPTRNDVDRPKERQTINLKTTPGMHLVTSFSRSLITEADEADMSDEELSELLKQYLG